MDEKTLIERLIKNELPDLERVRKNCLDSEEAKKRSKKGKLTVSCAIVAMAVLCLGVVFVRIVAVEAWLLGPGQQFADEGNAETEITEEERKKEKDVAYFQEGESDTSELIYREVEGDSISLKEGQKIEISNIGTREYKKVIIVKVWGSKAGDSTEELGDLAVGGTLSFQAKEAGEYVIYAVEDEAVNITGEVVIGYEVKTKESGR